MHTPHPGPAPQPLAIPEAEAADLARAIDTLVGVLDNAVTTHHLARTNDLAEFIGPERFELDQRFDAHLAALTDDLDALVQQRHQLDHFLSDAEVARADHYRQQREWEDQLRDHLAQAGA